MYNRVELIGNLGADPEVRTMSSGDKVANLTVATSERWRDRTTGDTQERTEWHRVSVWGNSADFCDRYLRKGAKVFVVGKIQTRKWQDRNGDERYSTEIVVRWPQGDIKSLEKLERRDDDRRTYNDEKGRYGEPPRDGAAAPSAGPTDDLDDEIPF